MGQRGEIWVLIQALLLIVLLWVPHIGPAWPQPGVFNAVGWGIVFMGGILLAKSAVDLGRSLTPFPTPLAQSELVITGFYRFVRHPIYLGVLSVALGISFISQSNLRILMTIILFIFFDLKARREEFWLEQRYPQYLAYKMRVKKIIPFFY